MKKAYFIVNPQAKNGKCKEIWKELEGKLKNSTIEYEVFFTERAKHATEIAKNIYMSRDERKKVVVAVGGDGTIQEIVSGFSFPIPSTIEISYIPCGSANDFSLGHQISKNPSEALDSLIARLEDEGRPMDLGNVKGKNINHNFINNMGLGYDAQICESVNKSKVKTFLNSFGLGKLIYVYFLIKLLFTYKTTTFKLTIDGQEMVFEEGWFCSISNQPYYGGGMKISPLALTDDGLLNVTMVNKINRWKLLSVFITVFWGGHTNFKEVHMFEGKNIVIQTENELPIHADGEIIGEGNVNIQVYPHAIRFIPQK